MRVSAATAPRVTLRKVGVFVVLTLLAALAVPVAAGANTTPPRDLVVGRILVKFSPGASAAAKSAARSAVGATKIKSIPQLGVDVLKVPNAASATALARLQRNPNVVYAEQDRVVELDQTEVAPNDPDWYRQWGPVLTRTDETWVASKGANVVIAILDTGVTVNADLEGKVVAGRNIIDGTSNTTDNHGHGTFSAGVAGGGTDNSIGAASYGWSAKVMPVKVMESSGTMSDLAAGITWATDNGAHVISMSLSGSSSVLTLHNAVKYAASKNVLLAAAAGNQGATDPRYPAAYPEVIAVAGTDTADALYSWSNYGTWVEVSAPGINRSMSRTGTVGSYSGTSSATPAVAGILALGRAVNTSAAAVRNALQSGVKPLPFVQYGRVDAKSMLENLGAAPAPSEAPAPSPSPEPSPTQSAEPSPMPSPDPSPTASPEPSPTSSPAPPTTITATVTTTKQKGFNVANVQWSGSVGTASVYVNDSLVGTSATGSFTHVTGQKGGMTLVYQVCDSNGCSAKVSATW